MSSFVPPISMRTADDGSIAVVEQLYSDYAWKARARLAAAPGGADYLAAAEARDAAVYPGRFGIKKRPHLSADQRVVEAEYAFLVQERTNFMALAAQFNSLQIFGASGITSCDLAFAFHPLFHHPLGRVLAHESVVMPANALRDVVFQKNLEQPADERKQRIALVAGGSGSGKTSFVQELADSGKYHAIYEHVFYHPDEALNLARAARERELKTDYYLVYREPVEAGASLWKRLETGGLSIRVPKVVNGHLFAAETCLALADKSSSYTDFTVQVIDNRNANGPAQDSTVNFLRNMVGNKIRDKAAIEATQRTETEQLFKRLEATLSAARQSQPFQAPDAPLHSWHPELFSPRGANLGVADAMAMLAQMPRHPVGMRLAAAHERQIKSPIDFGMDWNGNPLAQGKESWRDRGTLGKPQEFVGGKESGKGGDGKPR
jgi:hypothetical protein